MSLSRNATLWTSVAACALSASGAFAQTAAPQAGTTVLSPIVVEAPPAAGPRRAAKPKQAVQNAAQPGALDALSTSSEKISSSVYDAAGTVSVKSTAEMERQNINTPRDLVRDEPGVAYANQPTRGGGTNYNIRGIDGNRVRLEIDGVKVPDFPITNLGAPTGYTRDFVDFDTLKRVEIVKGAASALYGSDAIGGVVAYVTKDPADYLALVNKNWYMSVKGGFDTADRSLYSTVTGANRVGNVDSLLVVTRRWGHEITPNGSMSANPQSYLATNALGKIVLNTIDAGKLTLTGEINRKSISTDVRSDQSASVLSSLGDDTNQRLRLSLDWSRNVSWWFADTIKTKVYGTQLTREEISSQQRISGGQARYRWSDFDFDQTIFGGEVQLQAKRYAFGGTHLLTYGATFDQTDTSRPRNRYETNLVTGVTSTTVAGETYPNKNFPDTTTTMGSAYVQDIAEYGRWRFIPAVRVDVYDLKVNPDAAFASSNTGGFAIHDQTETAVSPKFGITYDLTNQLRAFGQYAHGFRAPPYDNANFGFRNASFGYEILPNGNLSPETVDGFEAGLRGRDASGSSFQISGFYNKYKDFIDTVNLGTGSSGLTQFQYRNVSNVTIYGAEAKGEWRFVPAWSLFGSLAYAIGENDDTKAPLDSVDPLKVIGGVRYRGPYGWSGEVRTTWVAQKDRVSIETGSSAIYKVSAHTTVDALLTYEIAPSMTINAGVFNIFDASYFNPADVAGVAAANPLLELYRAPGRSAAMNVTFRW